MQGSLTAPARNGSAPPPARIYLWRCPFPSDAIERAWFPDAGAARESIAYVPEAALLAERRKVAIMEAALRDAARAADANWSRVAKVLTRALKDVRPDE
jgi:hypothetical protein